MLTQHRNQNSTTNIRSKSARGSRLRSTGGLNITADEHVFLKLKQKEKKNRIKKSRSINGSKSNKVPANTIEKRKLERKRFSNGTTNKENEVVKDIELQNDIQHLQKAIDFIQSV